MSLIDVFDVRHDGSLLSLNDLSFKKYHKVWVDFASTTFLDHSRPPNQDEIEEYLNIKRELGHKGNSMWAYHSAINAFTLYFYKTKIQNTSPGVSRIINGMCKGESIKKAHEFEYDEIFDFFEKFRRELAHDKRWEVRAAYVAVAISGGNRTDELKK